MSTESIADAARRVAVAFNARPPDERVEHLRRQRQSYVASEAAWGSDADEAAYRDAIAAGDAATLSRLDAEGETRRWSALDRLAMIDPPRS